jgi:hypothetical protein
MNKKNQNTAKTSNVEQHGNETVIVFDKGSRYPDQKLTVSFDENGWYLNVSSSNKSKFIKIEIPKHDCEGLCITTDECVTTLHR